ncbi:hypothetical protein ACHAWX_002356 [Stephanocyclus meneghinianus]
MTSYYRSSRQLITLFGVVALVSPFYFKLEKFPSAPTERPITRRLDIAVDESDPLVGATLSVVSKEDPPPAVTSNDHERVSAILAETRDLITKAKVLLNEDGESRVKAHEMVNLATARFRQAKEHMNMREKKAKAAAEANEKSGSNLRPEERKDLEEEDQVRNDEDRAMDVSRNMYETFISFPECLEKKFEECLDIINADLKNLGLSTVEIVVHEKRNINQEGYNKVVIVTNDNADKVSGRAGDGIVSYPFTWDDAVLGTRVLGVDGKWNCLDVSPQDCCDTIKDSAKHVDTRGNFIECHFFVPFGGVGNARRNDRIFVNLSPDGRVHEAPIIQ